MKTLSLILFLLVNIATFGQSTKPLIVTASKGYEKGEYLVYDISVENNSDTVVCILHSKFINLNSSEPQGLALYKINREKGEYSMGWSFEDTTYSSWGTPKKGELLLPHQNIKFKILILKSSGIQNYILVDYFNVSDFCYTEFIKQMTDNPSRWYSKFKVVKLTIKI